MLQLFRESIGRYLAIAILGLIAITFIFFGIDFSITGTTFAAKVNGENIDLLDFQRELQSQESLYQQNYRLELTEDLRRELRRNVITRMVRSVALEQHVEDAGYRVSDARLSESIRSIEAFQAGGEFSADIYRARLASQGMTPTGFEVMQRRQLALRDLEAGLVASTFLTPAEFRRYIELYNERREIAYAEFRADDFLDQVELGDERIAEHYAANGARYMSDETVDFEYIELEQASLAAEVEVDDNELRAYFEERQDQFRTGEERRVRHILINVGDGDGDEAAARTRAEEALARVRGGEDFAAVAAELSEDPGTSEQGGDLGWIAPGMLEGPFEDALFAMQLGEIEGPVRSEFGFHVLKLDEIRGASGPGFDEIRDELREQYKSERAEELFYDQANRLDELAFDAYDELATVATGMNVPLQTVAGFPRSGDAALFANSAAVVQAAFDADVLETGVNSELVELSDDHVMVLRVTAHALPAPLPLEDVAEQIETEMRREEAEVLAATAKADFLEAVALGDESAETVAAHGGHWFPPRWVERTDAAVPTEILAAAFNLARPEEGEAVRESLFLASGDQAVLLLSNVEPGDPDSIAREARDQRLRELADQAAVTEMSSYVDNVAAQATVRIPDEVLEPAF